MVSKALQSELLGYLVRQSRDHELAEDIAQDAIVRLLDYRRCKNVENPRALLFRIAKNLLISDRRKHIARPMVEVDEQLADETPAIDRAMIGKQLLAEVNNVIDCMPPLRREVLLRRRLHQQSYTEIGLALDLSASAVEKHMTRALASLRNGVGHDGECAGRRAR